MEKKFIVTKSQLKRLVQKTELIDLLKDVKFIPDKKYTVVVYGVDRSELSNPPEDFDHGYGVSIFYNGKEIDKATYFVNKLLAKKYKGKLFNGFLNFYVKSPNIKLNTTKNKNHFKTPQEVLQFINSL